MQTVIATPTIAPCRRILVTSDIHGHTSYLQKVLELARFGGDDLLVVVGDLIEKGPDSLGTVRTVMSLCREGRAMATVGNVDKWRLRFYRTMAANADEALASELYDYTLKSRDRWGMSFYEEMARESGCSVKSPADILSTCRKVLDDHEAELDFLDGLPTVLMAGKYVFVHGGLPTENPEDVRTMDAFAALKRDWYLHEVRQRGLRFDPYVVVGHFPTPLFNEQKSCFNPIIDADHHVICIDGGCGIKPEGQLNLLILPSIGSDGAAATWLSWDELPTVHALDAQAENVDPFNLHWGDCDIRVLAQRGDCSFIEHLRTGRKLWTPTDHLYANNTQSADITDYHVPVAVGDTLSLLQTTDRGHIVKRGGVMGWYLGRIRPIQN